MKDLFKVLRLAAYVCALPLIATAMVSAHSWINQGAPVQEGVVSAAKFTGAQVDGATPFVSHVLRIDADGGVSARVLVQQDGQHLGAAGVTASLNQQGQAVAEAMVGDDGVVRFDNVSPGAYTFIASGDHCVATFGVYVMAAGDMVMDSGEIQFDVVAASHNLSEVRGILNAEIESFDNSYVPTETELPVVSASDIVALDSNGTFSGRVVPLVWSNNGFDMSANRVYLINQDGLAYSGKASADGMFYIDGVAPGSYDFVSFGPSGAASMQIEVVASATPVAQQSSTALNVSNACYPAMQASDFGVVLSEPVSGPVVVEVVVETPMPTAPVMPGYGGGFGGGFGGGGFGGFGGFGDLIGAALGIWAISEIADQIDDNDNVIQQPVVVPPVIIPPPPVSPTS